MLLYKIFKKIRFFSIIVILISYAISGISLLIDSRFHQIVKQNLKIFGFANGISYILSFFGLLLFIISQLYLTSSYFNRNGFRHLLTFSFYLKKFKGKESNLWIKGTLAGFIIGLLALPISIFLLYTGTVLIDVIKSVFTQVTWTCPRFEQMPEPCSFLDSFLSNLAVLPLVTIFYGFYTSLIISLIFGFIGGILGFIISKKLLTNRISKK